MNRTRFRTLVVAFVSSIAAGQYAASQFDASQPAQTSEGNPSTSTAPDQSPGDAFLEKKYLELETRAAHEAKLFQSLKSKTDVPPARLKAQHARIVSLLEASFVARQRWQRAELDALRLRLAEIDGALADREKNRQLILKARLDDLLAGREPVNPPIVATKRLAVVAPIPTLAPMGDDVFDVETRIRLQEIDLQAAEEELAVAQSVVERVQSLKNAGAVPESQLLSREKELRQAKTNIERIKVRLDGLQQQRRAQSVPSGVDVDLAQAEADLAEASAERQKAAADVRAAEAKQVVAQTQVEAAQASVTQAEALLTFRGKQLARIKELFEQKAVEPRLVDEQEQQMIAATAAVDQAKSNLKTNKALVVSSSEAIAQAQAALELADLRVKAARLKLEKLKKTAASIKQADVAPGLNGQKPGTTEGGGFF